MYYTIENSRPRTTKLDTLHVVIKMVHIVATCASEHFDSIKLGNEVAQCHGIVHEARRHPASNNQTRYARRLQGNIIKSSLSNHLEVDEFQILRETTT
jgi:hypothetical protein